MKVTTSKNKDFEVRCNFDKNEKCLDESTTTIEILSESEYVKLEFSNIFELSIFSNEFIKFMNDTYLPTPIGFQGLKSQFYGLE